MNSFATHNPKKDNSPPCTIFQTQLDHLVRMASNPGFKAHAWKRAKDLDACQSNLWIGMTDALTLTITGGQAKALESGDPTPRKTP
jgi:hypothetical protein